MQLIAHVVPPRGLWDEKCVCVEARVVGALLRLLARTSLAELPIDDRLPALLEDIGAALQEEHPEDVLLELRGVHLAAENVRSRKEMALELRQGQRHLQLRARRAHRPRSGWRTVEFSPTTRLLGHGMVEYSDTSNWLVP